MAETMVGDLTPWCNVDKAEKSKREEVSFYLHGYLTIGFGTSNSVIRSTHFLENCF